ncbi:TetR/AcrR family transcriptional regulator [Amycolatopsis tucumanensis]|uniref:TetR/AcrR family transcriptional regulator n=1 Tax=Amycolatopsis tucumanensis TaxID=401106 RepID=UPI001F30F74C|nr:TetR/AcrR family transcriptional regulator [Amycolatopsis tucumanensis]MCF6426977.1 TetR/AcrR family transcriptional regulator [Amycolatopsis tucumanensis]
MNHLRAIGFTVDDLADGVALWRCHSAIVVARRVPDDRLAYHRLVGDMVSSESTELLSVREQQRLMTRQRIVAAARRVFEEHGYGQASIGDITKAAKVNRATFYLHFPNKAEVFTEVYRTVREQQSAQYWSLLGAALAEGTAASVREWLDRALVWWEEQAPLLPAIHEAMASDLEVAARWKDQLDQLAAELGEYLAKFPKGRRETQRLRVELLMVQLDQLCFRAIVQKVFVIGREELLDVVTGMWVDALGLSSTGRKSTRTSS